MSKITISIDIAETGPDDRFEGKTVDFVFDEEGEAVIIKTGYSERVVPLVEFVKVWKFAERIVKTAASNARWNAAQQSGAIARQPNPSTESETTQ